MIKYFSEIGTKLSESITQPTDAQIKMPNMNSETLFLRPTDFVAIGNIISNMKLKGGGVDMINTKTLKTLAVYLVHPLSHIFNICIEQATWPKALKMADIIPIHKSGIKNKVSNYRPISLISNIAKFLTS